MINMICSPTKIQNLGYLFSDYPEKNERPIERVRHTVTSEDKVSLKMKLAVPRWKNASYNWKS